ncbi:MAG: hypothetical protein IKY12_02005, partial [Clostridia bacterium]|nr:hypothetical protein [Clostridia bacterium]
MSKKLLSILLTVCMLLSMVPMSLFVSAEENALPEVAFTPMAAEAVSIGDADEFIAYMSDSSNWPVNVTLTGDIDLTGKTWTPLGTADAKFSGTIDGANFAIKGLNVTSAGNTGLIGVAGNTTFKNLTIEGTVTGTGDYTGAFVGQLCGKVVFENCTNKATVNGTRYVGGFVGGQATSTVGMSIIVTDSVNEGTVTGTHADGRVGGFIGALVDKVAKNSSTFTGSVNKGNVTGAQMTGGFVGRFDVAATGATYGFDTCANYGDVETTASAGYTGGFVGLFTYNSTLGKSTYMFNNLYNEGNVSAIGKYNGGLVGYFRTYINETKCGFTNCMNVGTIYSSVASGGAVGGIIGTGNGSAKAAGYLMQYLYNGGSVTVKSGADVRPI